MLVTLAYPFDGNDPDETVELDDATARRLLSDGMARRPELAELTVDDLRAYATDAGIELAGATRKAQILAAIQATEKTRATTTPDTGVDPEEVS